MILSSIKLYISYQNQDDLIYKKFLTSAIAQKPAINISESETNSPEKTFEQGPKLSIIEKIDRVYNLIQQSLFDEALKLQEDLEAASSEPLDTTLLAIIKYNLGILYDFLGKYKIALDKLQEALLLIGDENINPILYFQILEAIAITHDNNGSHSEAIVIFQRVLDKKKIINGDSSLEVLYTYNNLAIALYNFGKFEECEKLFQNACHQLESENMKDCLEYSILILNLSSVFHDQGNYKKALNYASDATSYFGKQFAVHPLLAYSLNNQGFVYKTSGNTSKAESFVRKAFNMLECFFNDDHPEIAKINNNFGIVYLKRRSYDIAMTYFQTALETRKKLFGENHLDVGRTANNIGLIYFYKDEFELSLYYYRMALDIYLKTFGEEHPNVSIIYNNIGYSLASQNKYKEAIEQYLKAIKFRDRTLGKNDTYLAMTFMNLGSLLEFREFMWLGLDGQKKAFTINYKNFKWSNNDVETSYRKITNIEKKYDESKYLDSNFEI